MKTNEFKNLMGMYNLEVVEEKGIIFILKEGVTAATVSPTYQNCFSTHFSTMAIFCEPERQEIVDLIWEYAGTDVEARKDEKKHRLVLDLPLLQEEEVNWYLYTNLTNSKTGLTLRKEQGDTYKLEYTLDEILDMNRKGFRLEDV